MCSVRDLTHFLLEWPERREPLRDPGGVHPATNTLPRAPDDPRAPLFAAIRDVVAPTLR